MSPEELQRIHDLSTPWCSAELINSLYALDLVNDDRLRKYFARTKPEIFKEDQDEKGGTTLKVDRYLLETIMQSHRLMPRKWVAAKLGMTEACLENTISTLANSGALYKHYMIPQLIEKDFDDILLRLFGELKFRRFSSFNSFCKSIHEQLLKHYKIQVEPLVCVTSQFLKETPTEFANSFDCITFEPIGTKYQVWLDFKKPMNLAPDCCSTLLYSREREILDSYLAGTTKPDLPEALMSQGLQGRHTNVI